MTCIVGLELNNEVWIGGDSAASNGWRIHATRLKKVFKHGRFLIGYTTSFRMGQLLQYSLTIDSQKKTQDSLEYMVTTFIDGVRKCLKDGGFAKVENGVEEGGGFLVGYRGRLYTVDIDFQVNMSRDGFGAVGCGADFALGNLLETKTLNPKKRLKRALKAAGHFSTGVCGPYYVSVI